MVQFLLPELKKVLVLVIVVVEEEDNLIFKDIVSVGANAGKEAEQIVRIVNCPLLTLSLIL
jgi:hypothetical protein